MPISPYGTSDLSHPLNTAVTNGTALSLSLFAVSIAAPTSISISNQQRCGRPMPCSAVALALAAGRTDPCRTVPNYSVVPCRTVTWCRAVPYRHVVSCRAVPYHAVSYSSRVFPCRVVWCSDVASCLMRAVYYALCVTSSRVVPYQIISCRPCGILCPVA